MMPPLPTSSFVLIVSEAHSHLPCHQEMLCCIEACFAINFLWLSMMQGQLHVKHCFMILHGPVNKKNLEAHKTRHDRQNHKTHIRLQTTPAISVTAIELRHQAGQ